ASACRDVVAEGGAAIRRDAVGHVLREDQRLAALVGLERRNLREGLQTDESEHAEYEDDERHQHLEEGEAALPGRRFQSCAHQLHPFAGLPSRSARTAGRPAAMTTQRAGIWGYCDE